MAVFESAREDADHQTETSVWAGEEGDSITETGPTALACRVRRLHNAVSSAIAKRDRLPVPLFWSLLRAEVMELRKARQRDRAQRKILYGSGE